MLFCTSISVFPNRQFPEIKIPKLTHFLYKWTMCACMWVTSLLFFVITFMHIKLNFGINTSVVITIQVKLRASPSIGSCIFPFQFWLWISIHVVSLNFSEYFFFSFIYLLKKIPLLMRLVFLSHIQDPPHPPPPRPLLEKLAWYEIS